MQISMTIDTGPASTDMGRRELAGIFIACGLLLIVQWVLSFWRITPPVIYTWSRVLQDISIFWACGLAATNFAAYILAKNSKEAAVMALLGLSVFAITFAAHGAEPSLPGRLSGSAKWFGLFGLAALAYQARRPNGLKRFLTAICFSLFVPISIAYLTATYVLRPKTMDLYAYSFDLSLGWGVAQYFFNLVHRSWIVSVIATAAYICLLGAYEILFALQSRFADRTVAPALRVFLIAAVLGFGCYFIFPVSGPTNFFGDNYPFHLPGFSDFIARPVPALPGARNGMPSLHFAWALLLLVNVPRELKHAKAAFALFCFLTMVATMGLGEHFFVDLIAALPFAAATQAIGLSMNDGMGRRHAGSILRSGLIFAAFLTLLALNPDWLHRPLEAWTITAILIAHFIVEIRWQRATSAQLTSAASPIHCTA
jgi:hypothetical protein